MNVAILLRVITLAVCSLLFCDSGLQAEDLSPGHRDSNHNNEAQEEVASLWTCSMHPQIKLPRPGTCPICGMDLVPVHTDNGSDATLQNKVVLRLSEQAQHLADIQTTRVVRRTVTKKLRLVGSIDYDETRLTHITAWVPGRIERMFVDFTGIAVKKGDHMLQLYSPELISTQEELIQAVRSLQRLKSSSSALVRESTERSVQSAREKLLLLGLTEAQVQAIRVRGKAEDSVTIYAPRGGVVVERSATEGMYVQEGTRIYSIADLSSLWVYLDAYETDLPWIRYGQEITFTTRALPGTTFAGTVSFISPMVSSDTRTTRIRVNIDNSKGLLKPGLFVKGVIEADVYGEGKVINTDLKGKYIGPMHPEIIRDVADQCPICGMDLVPAEELGYITAPSDPELPLVIPDSAALITGKRAVVYVKHPDEPTFEPRSVVLGPEASGFYVIIDGLKEDELVVTNGAFKIDADLQIKGRPSMMNPVAGSGISGNSHNH